jgi:hypothetical protein
VKVGGVGRNLPDVRLAHADQNVLGLDVRVDDLALGVQVVKALQDLGVNFMKQFRPEFTFKI